MLFQLFRYTLFYVLYLLGIAGEFLSIHQVYQSSTSELVQNGLFVMMLIYPFAGSFMYFHMIKQRRKYLSTPKIESKKSKKKD